jgi:hypothetical protein
MPERLDRASPGTGREAVEQVAELSAFTAPASVPAGPNQALVGRSERAFNRMRPSRSVPSKGRSVLKRWLCPE